MKEELRETFITEKQLFRIAQEAALYYANWWSREYLGGSHDNTPSREKIAFDLGIKKEQSNDLHFWEKRGALSVSNYSSLGRWEWSNVPSPNEPVAV